MKYEVLIFDADKTLFDFEAAEKFALKSSFEQYKIKYNEDFHLSEFKKINKKIWTEFEQKLITAEELKPERFKRYFSRVNIDGISPHEFSDCYLNFLSMNNTLLPGAKTLIEEISTNFRLALLTNGMTKVQKPRFSSSEIFNYFDAIIISEEVGIAKPDKRIFEIVMERLNFTDKIKALMIGDNLSSDIEGGNLFGMDTCWFNPDKKENNTDIEPTYEISKLYQLKSIVY
jgi:putative hydrolase of the HAD superfamily